MDQLIVQKEIAPKIKGNTKSVWLGLSLLFLCIGGLTIVQDLLASIRNDYAFYFSESFLFKILWFLFVPILTMLYSRLESENVDNLRLGKIIVLIGSPIAIHFLVFPFVAFVFSVLFFDGRYGLYKFFSYTLAHDLYKLVIIYAGFVLGYRFFQKRSKIVSGTPEQEVLKKIIITNGRDNTVICVDEILQITSATPYIFIHLENKKYLHSETLKSITNQLDNNTFIRVHKSTLVNLGKVKSFKSRLNGDYDVLLKNGDTVRLSRTYAANFKVQFKTGHQDTV